MIMVLKEVKNYIKSFNADFVLQERRVIQLGKFWILETNEIFFIKG